MADTAGSAKPERSTYLTAQLEAVATKLDAMPEIERKCTKKDAIKFLSKNISVLLSRGYTIDMLPEILNSCGLVISKQTLKHYLQSAKSKEEAENQSQNQEQATMPKARGRKKKQVNESESNHEDATKTETNAGTAAGTFTPKADTINM